MPSLLAQQGLAPLSSAPRPAPGASSLPAQPPARALRHAWWRYVERGHTHEVLAAWSEPDGTLRLRESSLEARDAGVEDILRVSAPWEVNVARWQLESRLAILGAYWQQNSSTSTWRRLDAPPGAPSPDPRRNLVIEAPHAPLLHHYHAEGAGGDMMVAALHAPQNRFVVLRARLDVPSLEIGRIDVLHPRVPDVMARSLVMREQLAFMDRAMVKLVARDDYMRAFGAGGDARAARLVNGVVDRVVKGQLEKPAPRDDESDVYREFLVTLNDPRLRALHAKFLGRGEEATLLAAGPAAIRKAIAAKRLSVPHTAQHLLTLLEASLLAREKMQGGVHLAGSDPEVQALARLAYYL